MCSLWKIISLYSLYLLFLYHYYYYYPSNLNFHIFFCHMQMSSESSLASRFFSLLLYKAFLYSHFSFLHRYVALHYNLMSLTRLPHSFNLSISFIKYPNFISYFSISFHLFFSSFFFSILKFCNISHTVCFFFNSHILILIIIYTVVFYILSKYDHKYIYFAHHFCSFHTQISAP